MPHLPPDGKGSFLQKNSKMRKAALRSAPERDGDPSNGFNLP
jgi:hypothetical protein